jgi:DNA-binding winged helix-turn-helix (wHTH) protein
MTDSAFHTLDGANRAIAEQSLEFGRFRLLPRQRLLLADGAPIELGTRAFELLLALLEANGALVSKEHLLARVWPGVVVAEDNLKVQVLALRRALGEDRDFIRTEFGRGYRFTAAVRSTVSRSVAPCPMRRWPRSIRQCGYGSPGLAFTPNGLEAEKSNEPVHQKYRGGHSRWQL